MRHCKALNIAIDKLAIIACVPTPVVHPTYSKGAMKALKKIEKLIRTRRLI